LENAIRRATVLGIDNFLDHSNTGNSLAASEPGRPSPRDVDPSSVQLSPSIVDKLDKLNLGIEKDGKTAVFEAGISLKEIAKEAALLAEKEAIAKVLQETRWNRKKTAKILNISYKTLLTKIKETGLDEN
jgi:DNA-binding NtrC family response regulator